MQVLPLDEEVARPAPKTTNVSTKTSEKPSTNSAAPSTSRPRARAAGAVHAADVAEVAGHQRQHAGRREGQHAGGERDGRPEQQPAGERHARRPVRPRPGRQRVEDRLVREPHDARPSPGPARSSTSVVGTAFGGLARRERELRRRRSPADRRCSGRCACRSARSRRPSARSSLTFTPTNCTFPAYFVASAFKVGASARHGGHPAYQKFTHQHLAQVLLRRERARRRWSGPRSGSAAVVGWCHCATAPLPSPATYPGSAVLCAPGLGAAGEQQRARRAPVRAAGRDRLTSRPGRRRPAAAAPAGSA